MNYIQRYYIYTINLTNQYDFGLFVPIYKHFGVLHVCPTKNSLDTDVINHSSHDRSLHESQFAVCNINRTDRTWLNAA